MMDAIQVKCDDPELVIDRFYNGMTIRELAKARRVCGETIRIRLKKNLKKLEAVL
jgi:DNA-directed RNA polymerase specialized sigma24 family protein